MDFHDRKKIRIVELLRVLLMLFVLRAATGFTPTLQNLLEPKICNTIRSTASAGQSLSRGLLLPLLGARRQGEDGEEEGRKRSGWVSKVLRRKKRSKETAFESVQTSMYMTSSAEAISPDTLPSAMNLPNMTSDYSGQRWVSKLEPSMSRNSTLVVGLPVVSASTALSTLDAPLAAAGTTTKTDFAGGPLLSRVTRSWLQSFLYDRLENRWSRAPPQNLRIQIAPRGNVLARMVRGHYKLDGAMEFDRLVLQNIRLSGGKIAAKAVKLNIIGFTPKVFQRNARYLSRFHFDFDKCKFTRDDLMESTCIRNGLRNLLFRILKRVGVRPDDISITSIDILPCGKISCCGETTTGIVGTHVPFEVRSRIGTSSRGHVLTFPGLEVSLGPGLGVFMPVVPTIDLDIGHNARVHNLDVKGSGAVPRVTLSASATITPERTIKLRNYIQSKDAYLAQFSFDVGRWLTKIGNFTR